MCSTNSSNCCYCSYVSSLTCLLPLQLEGYYEFIKSSEQFFLALTGYSHSEWQALWLSKLGHARVLCFPGV